MPQQNPTIYGPAFPFSNSVQGVLGNKTRKDSIRTSIQLILTTPKGSIVYDPLLGSYVPWLVFDPLDDAALNLLLYYVVHDLETQDPRILVSSISVTKTEQHHILLWVGYKDRNDPSSQQEQAPVEFRRG